MQPQVAAAAARFIWELQLQQNNTGPCPNTDREQREREEVMVGAGQVGGGHQGEATALALNRQLAVPATGDTVTVKKFKYTVTG